ncbi:MAG: sugar ABC transporter substrate-binding protein [Anaerolineae bacterium]|nr:sugar ABC transporter substrate-binding protein [Anaerolineae bacterium]
MRINRWFALCMLVVVALVVGMLPPHAAVAQDPVKAYYTPGKFDGQELKVVINSSFYTTAGGEAAFKNLNSQFEQLSGAKVTLIPMPENEMYDKVRLEMINNSGTYDMMHTGAGGAKDYGLSGFLIPLPQPPDVDDFYAGDVAQYSIGGELYGLPMIADTNILYWRTDLFEKAGLDPKKPPETYTQLRDYALKLTTDTNGKHPGDAGFDANKIDIYGLAFKGVAGLGSTWEWYNYVYAFGGDLLDKDYNPTINSPEAVAALTWVVDNFRKYKIYPPDTPTYDYTEFHTLFIQGRVAMAINWPYMWGLIQDPKQSKVVDKVAVGRKPGEKTHGGNIGGWSWNVFKMSKHQDLAIAYAKWMASADASLAFAEGTVGNPVRKSVAEKMSKKDPALYAAINANLADGRGVKWLDTGPSWMEIEKVQYQAIQEALIGSKEPKAALDDAAAEAKKILDKNKFYTDLLPKLQGKK